MLNWVEQDSGDFVAEGFRILKQMGHDTEYALYRVHQPGGKVAHYAVCAGPLDYCKGTAEKLAPVAENDDAD